MRTEIGNYTGDTITVVLADNQQVTFGEYRLPPGESILESNRLACPEFFQDGRSIVALDLSNGEPAPRRIVFTRDDANKAHVLELFPAAS